MKLNDKQSIIFLETERLYKQSQRKMAHWMWKNHVLIVSQFAFNLANKYNANSDYVYAGALLHDLGDVWLERDKVNFEAKSRYEGEKILKKAKFNSSEIAIVIAEIIEPHSCYPLYSLPQIIEGKILATADALAHIKTDFYFSLKEMKLPNSVKQNEFNAWATNKLKRDFNNKIFFKEIRDEIKPVYDDKLKLFATK